MAVNEGVAQNLGKVTKAHRKSRFTTYERARETSSTWSLCRLSAFYASYSLETVFKSNYPQHDGDEIPSLGKKTEEKTPCKIMGWAGVARARIRSMPNTIKLVV